MGRLQPGKLHVRLGAGLIAGEPVMPRRYTLTHSDASGDLFLTIGQEYDRNQVAGWYTRLMRDEVLAEWRDEGDGAVRGLVLWAASPAASDGLSSCQLAASSIRSARDGLATPEKIDASRPLLPPDT